MAGTDRVAKAGNQNGVQAASTNPKGEARWNRGVDSVTQQRQVRQVYPPTMCVCVCLVCECALRALHSPTTTPVCPPYFLIVAPPCVRPRLSNGTSCLTLTCVPTGGNMLLLGRTLRFSGGCDEEGAAPPAAAAPTAPALALAPAPASALPSARCRFGFGWLFASPSPSFALRLLPP
jgi:hypothetical protein